MPPPLASTPRGVVRLLSVAGATLAVAGIGDLALFLWPPRFGDPEWEFGTVAHLIDALPLPTMSLLLLGLAAVGTRRGRGWPRVISVGLTIAVCALVVLLALFLLDIPVALRALAVVAAHGRPPDPSIHPGLARVVGKTCAFGGAYVIGWTAMARILWVGTRHRS